MRAIVKMKSGPPEVLRLREVEKSRPKLDEVLIQIRPATVTCGDVVMRRGRGSVESLQLTRYNEWALKAESRPNEENQ